MRRRTLVQDITDHWPPARKEHALAVGTRPGGFIALDLVQRQHETAKLVYRADQKTYLASTTCEASCDRVSHAHLRHV